MRACGSAEVTLSPLQRFFLAALLWLPLAFFFWFAFAAAFAWPVIALAKLVLLQAWPTLFTAIGQGADLLDAQGHVLAHPGYLMQITSGVLVNAAPAGAPPHFGFLEPVINPMVYGYALPLFAGLVLATPLTRLRRLRQLAIGMPLIWCAQALGVVAESLKSLALDAGPAGAEAAQRAGVSLEFVALCYQFGYLILPALVPVALWIVLNRSFIEMLTRAAGTEPAATVEVETSHTGVH
jgi:hypothetical protein